LDIIVCIKQVPNVREVSWDPDTGNLIRTGLPSVINPNDKNAVEAALSLKEKHGGSVTIISMGPPQVDESLREALSMGADSAIQLTDKEFAGADCWATSYTLGQAVRKIGRWDLILTGVEAMDGNTAQVGPEVAKCLDIPLLSYARSLEVSDKKIRVSQKLGDLTRVLEAPLPALVTVDREANQPRVAPMDCVLECYEKVIPVWTAEDLGGESGNYGLKGSPTRLRKIFTPKLLRGKVEIFDGDYETAVGKLVDKLKELYLI